MYVSIWNAVIKQCFLLRILTYLVLIRLHSSLHSKWRTSDVVSPALSKLLWQNPCTRNPGLILFLFLVCGESIWKQNQTLCLIPPGLKMKLSKDCSLVIRSSISYHWQMLSTTQARAVKSTPIISGNVYQNTRNGNVESLSTCSMV